MDHPAIKSLLVFLLLSLLERSNAAFWATPPRRSVEEHRLKFQQKSAARQNDCSINQKSGRVFYPIRYGADPSGAKDSSDAIESAINDAYATRGRLQLLHGITDLGGVVIDLQGGSYQISKPIRFPPNTGNILIHGGTIRASHEFPTGGYLIEIRSIAPPGPNPSPYLYEDITLRDILLDANFRGGGVLVINAVRTRIDNCFFIHFASHGLLVERGHETYVSECFLGQHITAGGDPHERNFTGVAIDLASNDNAITDVAIFSAATGVVLRGQANILTGVHCYNKATFWGGVGVLVRPAGLGQTRISNSYMDWTGIVMEDPVQVHVTNGFFLGNANIVLKAIEGHISGLNIVDNMFTGDGTGVPTVTLDESRSRFKSIDQVVVDRNNARGMKLKSTAARRLVAARGAKWMSNFTSELIFPDRINHLQYSLFVRGKAKLLPAHAVTSVLNNVVVVESNRVVDGVVSIAVDQNAMLEEKNAFMN